MRKTPILTLFIILIFPAVALAAIPVDVTVGKGTVVTLKTTSKRVAIADPVIADIMLISPTEIVINGKKVGETGLIIWDEEGNRTFFDVNVFGDLDELREHIRALAPEEEVEVERAADSILLKGTLKSEDTIKKIDTISKTYAAKVINFLKVAEAQQVMLEVRVAQLDKSKLSELGLSALAKGIDSGNAEITAPGLFASPSGNIGGDAGLDVTPGIENFDDIGTLAPQIGVAHFPSGVAAVLRALATRGFGKILAEPNLVVRSGEKGSFHVGTRVPVQQVTGVGGERTVSIVFEEVGIRLNFAPEVLDTGVIRLKIDPAEVSNVTRFIEFASVIAPEIDTRTVRTSVDLKEGESLILAGLLSEEMKRNIKKVPILGDIPILGAIFRSTKEEIDNTELAFFITPKLVKPLQPGERPELPGEKSPTPKEKRQFRWIPLLGKAGPSKGEPAAAGEAEVVAASVE